MGGSYGSHVVGRHEICCRFGCAEKWEISYLLEEVMGDLLHGLGVVAEEGD